MSIFIDKCRRVQDFLGLDEKVLIGEGSYCCYYPKVAQIDMNYEDSILLEEDFYSFIETFFPKAREFSIMIWSLLHEFGHHYDIEDYDIDNDRALRYIVNSNPDANIFAYFNLPSELAATSWAIDFVSKNYDRCKEADEFFKAEAKYFCSTPSPLLNLKITNIRNITITKENGETICLSTNAKEAYV